MTNRTRPGAGRSAPGHRDGRVFLTVAALCAVLVGGLAVISHGAPSSAQYDSVVLEKPVITEDEGCANFATFWTVGSGANVPVEAIEGLTNCRLSDQGQWFVPGGASDRRLPERSRLSSQERDAVESLRLLVLTDLNLLEVTLPGSLKESLDVNYLNQNAPVFGHTRRGRNDLGAKRARYQRIAQAFLLDLRRIQLANYVGWVMERRSEAVGRFEAACLSKPDFRYLNRACTGMRNEFGVAGIPLLWDLTDPVLLEEYLVWSVRSGMPLPATIPPPSIE